MSKGQWETNTANIAAVLREEIGRLARKEIRKQTSVLKKMSAQYRRDIAEMKRRLSNLQHKITPLQKQVLMNVSSPPAEGRVEHVRFTAKSLRSQRKRLGRSAADCGKLIGVTGQTMYSWEQETSRARKQQVARIASLRHLGKREALTRLEQLKGGGKKKSKQTIRSLEQMMADVRDLEGDRGHARSLLHVGLPFSGAVRRDSESRAGEVHAAARRRPPACSGLS